MVEHDLAKVNAGVRFSSPAPLFWSSGVVVNMPPCHGGDREFDPRLDRHLKKQRIV